MPKLTIYGKQEMDRILDEDKDLSVAFLNMRIRNIVKNKATDDLEYKLENLGELIIKQEGKEAFRGAKDLWKSKLRNSMKYVYDDLGVEEDFEEWRIKKKNQMLAFMPEIIALLIK